MTQKASYKKFSPNLVWITIVQLSIQYLGKCFQFIFSNSFLLDPPVVPGPPSPLFKSLDQSFSDKLFD